MDPFCKDISKRFLSGKAPSHEVVTFMNIKGLIYKHIIDSNEKFVALVIPKSWNFMVLVEAHDKLGHQEVNRTYHLMKCQYYWKGMDKDICNCALITNCALCKREKAKPQVYPLQIYLIAMDLVSASGNILTITDHLTGWPEAFPIPDKKADTLFLCFHQ